MNKIKSGIFLVLCFSQFSFSQRMQKGLAEGYPIGGSGVTNQSRYPICVNEYVNTEAFRRTAVENFRRANPDFGFQQAHFQKGQKITFNSGDSTTFWVARIDAPSFDIVWAQLKRIGPTTEIWVATSEIRNGHVDTTGLGSIPEQMLNDLEYSTPAGSQDPSKGIKKLDDAFFGNPPNYGRSNGKVAFLITDIKDGFTGTGGYVAGFFYSVDQDSSPITNPTYYQFCNKRDILYIDSYPGLYFYPSGPKRTDISTTLATIAHEYQHLIFYNYNAGIDPGTFVNEGLSELAPVICGYGLDSPAGYTSDPNIDLFVWRPVNDPAVLDDYDRSRLWTTYLFTQAGDSVAKRIVQAGTGLQMTRYNAGLSAVGYYTNGTGVLKDFAVANVAQDTTVVTAPRFGYPGGFIFSKPFNTGNFSDPNQAASNQTIQPYGVVYLRFYSGANLTVNISNTANLSVKVIKLGQSGKTVSDLTLGTNVNFADFGTSTANEIIFALVNTSGSLITYSYTATGILTEFLVDMIYNDVWNSGEFYRGFTYIAAVKFSPPIFPAHLKKARFDLYDARDIEIYIYDKNVGTGKPGNILWTQRVPTSANVGLWEIDLDSLNLDFSDEFFIGCKVLLTTPGDTNYLLYDNTAPNNNRSYYFSNGTTWDLIPNSTLSSIGAGNWAIQALVSVNDAVPPNLKPGILQHPVFTENLNVILASDKSLRNISGTIKIDAGAETPLTFINDGNASNDYIKVASYTLSSTGTFSAKVKVSGTNAYGFVSDVDSVTLSVSRVTLSVAGGLTSQDGKSLLQLPAFSLKKDSYITLYKQEDSDLLSPDPSTGSRSLSARYLFGPGGLDLDRPGTLFISVSPPRYPEKTGIARLENGVWRYLGGVYENGKLSVPLTRLGTYQVREYDEIQKVIPEKYGLAQNYPNPFNPTTRIDYDLPVAGPVTLLVYNILGQEVRTLVNGFKPAGSYQVFWDGRNQFGQTVASGIYFYQIRASQYVKFKKMLMLQ